MNPFQLVLKQMRQRALSTWLTLLSIVIGSALAVAVLILQRESESLFVQKDFGYDLLVGAKGSPMQLVLNTVYHVDKSPGNIRYIVYEALRANRPMVKQAVPYVVGDTYKGLRVAGTTPAMFGFDEFTAKPPAGYDESGRLLPGHVRASAPEEERAGKTVATDVFEIRVGRKFTLAQGRVFHPRKFEAVLGAEVTERAGLKLGDRFKVAHDAGGKTATQLDEHDEQWTVVGVLDRTGTADDRVIYIPLVSFYAIPQHESSMDRQTAMRLGEDLTRFDKTATRPTTTTAPVAPQPKPDDHNDHKHDDHDHGPAKPIAPSSPASPQPKPDDHADHKHNDHDHAPAKPAAPVTPAVSVPSPVKDDHDHDHKPGSKPASMPATGPATAATPKHDDHDHHDHEEAYELNPDGTIDLKLEKDRWLLSAVMVRTRGGAFFVLRLQDMLVNGPEGTMGVNPADVMREFFTTFLSPTTYLLLAIAIMVAVTAAVSILVSIYNAVAARQREIAIMRALGATRARVLSLICIEAGLIGLIGALVGLVLGHGLASVLSGIFERKMGVGINWIAVSGLEWVYLGGIVLLAVLAGLVPGLKAYRTPVATNLVAA